jgi:hypothetical protein
VTGEKHNLPITHSLHANIAQILITGNEMGRTCGKNERNRAGYSRQTKKKYDFEHPRINERITLKLIRIKYCRRGQTGSVSLRIGIQVAGSGQYDSEASGCAKSGGISWLAEKLQASQ